MRFEDILGDEQKALRGDRHDPRTREDDEALITILCYSEFSV